MGKIRKKLTRDEKLAKDRLRKRAKYAQIKRDPELYAIQKEKERVRYLARKENNKICSIKEMTPRAQRDQRKRWRKNSENYLKRKVEKKRIEMVVLENSSSVTVDSITHRDDPLETIEATSSSSKVPKPPIATNALRRMRYNHLKIVKKLKEKIRLLEKQNDNLRKQKNKVKKEEDSVEKKVNEVLINIRSDNVSKVKKQLAFSEIMSRNLENSYKSINKKDKKTFVQAVIKDQEKLRKHKLLHKLPFSQRKQKVTIKTNGTIALIHSFFEEDTNSRIAAGKKEFISKKGIKKQKRYLNDNLKNLHQKFVKEHCSVSYSTFCKYRPYWIVFPDNRDTCQCKLHANVNLLIKALNNAKIVTESTGTQIIKRICCEFKQECLERTCQNCCNKVLYYHEFRNDKKIVYYQWIVDKKAFIAKDGSQRNKIVSIKKRFEDYPRNVVINFELILTLFLKHTNNISMQYMSIKKLKENLDGSEILMHVDFSENYCLKYNEEIQSFHFGGSREQVSLHTGVMYYKDADKVIARSFCTMSSCLKHDAGSIWAHLSPILRMAKDLVNFKVVHFLSDSPSSQYRNRYVFYMITKLKDINPNITRVTWNYQESGHGKGAPDGIGAVVKRTADNFVKYSGDIGSFEDFTSVVSNTIKNIHFDVIPENDILQIEFPPSIPGFKGTLNVHQVFWSADNQKMINLRKLSCFECQDCFTPCIHNKHLGTLFFDNYGETAEEQSIEDTEIEETHDIEQERPTFKIDTPTILNNIRDSSLLDNLHILDDPTSLLSPGAANSSTCSVLSVSKNKSNKVTILSDVRLNWENMAFTDVPKYKKDVVSTSRLQQELESFIRPDEKENQRSNLTLNNSLPSLRFDFFNDDEDSDDDIF